MFERAPSSACAPHLLCQTLLKDQDSSLDQLGDAVHRIGAIALEIGSEITSQNQMIDDLEQDVDHAQSSIDLVTAKTKDLVKKSGGCQWFLLIVFLVFVLVCLVFLVIYS
jgi:hypothetical protein